MDIHEYQAKELLANFGVQIPRGGLAYSPEQAAYRTPELGGDKWVVKAQIHSGGRGKAGGIKVCRLRARGGGRRRRAVRQAAGHAPDRPAGQGRLSPLCRRRRRHQARALSRPRARPPVRAGDDRRPRAPAAWRSRRSPRRDPQSIIRSQRRSRRRHALFPGARDRLRPRPRAGADQPGGQHDPRLLPRLRRSRCDDGGDQSAGRHRGRPADRARRQDDLRRQRAVPPSEDRRAARQVAGGCARDQAPPTAASAMSASTAISAASSTAPASPWRPWT